MFAFTLHLLCEILQKLKNNVVNVRVPSINIKIVKYNSPFLDYLNPEEILKPY